ncbi:MAG: c-type cytochrome [Planctomycetes bacterium]|nr:c-type cytochrome [Planctomycetota bacterium]
MKSQRPWTMLRWLSAGGAVLAISAGVSAAFFPLTTDRVDVELGASLFQKRCAACHSISAGGSAGLGPTLHGIATAAATRVEGQDAEEYIVRSIIDPAGFRAPGAHGEMPQNIAASMSSADVISLAAFLMSQAGEPRYRRLLELSELPKPKQQPAFVAFQLASVEHGRDLYFNKLKCAFCHPLDASGSRLLAPSLVQAGLHQRQFLDESIRRPSATISPSYRTCQVLHDGLVVTGRRLPAGPGQVRLMSSDSQGIRVVEFNEVELETVDGDARVAVLPQSEMPALTDVNAEEISALLDFLATLR